MTADMKVIQHMHVWLIKKDCGLVDGHPRNILNVKALLEVYALCFMNNNSVMLISFAINKHVFVIMNNAS